MIQLSSVFFSSVCSHRVMHIISIVMQCGQKNCKLMCIIDSATDYAILELVGQSSMYFWEKKPQKMCSTMEPDVNFTRLMCHKILSVFIC